MIIRPRRLRENKMLRNMIKECSFKISDLIYPLFVIEGENIKEEIKSMPGVFRFSPDRLMIEISEIISLGIKAIMLFGIPGTKSDNGCEAYDENGIIQRTVSMIKSKFPSLYVITDVCLCEYTTHGHCGVIKNNTVDNDESADLIAKTALSHAVAGADMVAPSDMMDGRVLKIRKLLDENDFKNIPIMSYSVKYASGFYGPFRDAADSAPAFGDRKAYQMDFSSRRDAKREIMLDVSEGADIIMVKPGMAYLDVVKTAKEICDLPVAVYNVSGEYSMVKAAAASNMIDEIKVVYEILTSFKRAGADLIITYHAKDVARWEREGKFESF